MKIPLVNIDDELWIEIIGETDDSSKEISEEEAMLFGESSFQIKEGCTYEYKFNIPNFKLSNKNPIVSISKFDSHKGRLNPNIYVGTLTLEVLDKESNLRGKFNVEVQSVKSEYREDYRYMLKCITDKCTDLIMQIDSPVYQYFETNFDVESQTLYQQFCFVKSEIDSLEFEEAIQKIISNPTTKWETKSEEKDIRSIRRFTQKNIKQLVSKSNRMPFPASLFLVTEYNIESVPIKLQSVQKIESIDSAENRFIKHTLEEFLFFCENCEAKFEKYSRAKYEASILSNKISNFLDQSFFKEISRPVFLKLNSPVLQRKNGYREVLNARLKFDLAAKLIWQGGDNVYEAGKKDIATLYEYWLFFTLLDILKDEEVFNIESKTIQELIQFDEGRLSLNLKQGKMIALKGFYDCPTRKLNIQFSYNKSFGGGKAYPSAGSYTTTLRPDYTLSIWPAEILDINEAEKKEIITHIHFDAKYKVNNFYELVKKSKNEELSAFENEELIREEEEEKKGTFNNVDLLKMHAYKDAIRRTGGAYVLYPGEGKDKPFRGFHEIIPGLGAFVLKPNKDQSGKEELKTFILKVVNHFLDRASQRENISSKVYDVHKVDKTDDTILNEPMPEYLNGIKLIPDDTFVLVGYYKMETWDWIKSNGLYNARAESARGSLRLGPGEAGARYLLLHSKNATVASRLLRILEIGPRVFSKQNLIDSGYPYEPSQNCYLVYKVEEIKDQEFNNKSWDITKLKGYKTGRASALPFSVTLTELMKALIK